MVFALSCGGGASSVPDGGAGAGAPGGHAGSTGATRGVRAGRRERGRGLRWQWRGRHAAPGGTTAGGGGGAGRAGAGGGADRAGAGGGQVGGGGDGGSAVDGGSPDGATANVAAPRPIAPLSTATVTSRRPTLHWLLAAGSDGAHVRDLAETAPARRRLPASTRRGSNGCPCQQSTDRARCFWCAYGRSGATTGPVVDARLAVHRRDSQRRDSTLPGARRST